MADITKINLNGTVYTVVDSAATAAITAEETRAKAAESANTSAISAEVVARQSADTALEQAISGKADASTTLSGYGITDAYTKTEVDNKLASAATATTAEIASATSGLQVTLTAGTGIDITNNVISCTIDTTLYVVVSTLPAEPAAGNENKIHLVPLATGSTGVNDYYEEYLWKGDAWEYLGTKSVEIDLSDYWTSAQTESAITAATSGKVDTSAYTAYTAATDSAITAAQGDATSALNLIGNHTGNTNNPHQVTAAQLGISASYSAQTETLILVIPTGSTS